MLMLTPVHLHMFCSLCVDPVHHPLKYVSSSKWTRHTTPAPGDTKNSILLSRGLHPEVVPKGKLANDYGLLCALEETSERLVENTGRDTG